MLRVTLAQMRRSLGRLTAAGIAIVIGTAFVAATLLAGNVITRTTYDSISAQFGDADLVVSPGEDHPLTPDDLAATQDVAGVDSASGQFLSWQELTHGNRTIFQGIIPTTPDGRLMPLRVADGAMPGRSGEIALPQDVAERFGVGVGDTISLQRYTAADDGTAEATPEDITVVGIVEDPFGAYAMMGGAAVVDAQTLASWQSDAGSGSGFDTLAVALTPGADAGAVRDALTTELGHGVVVQTPDERAADTAASLTGGEDLVFMIFVLTFAAIALLVAGLVIANTFQVLVAQRTRTLALLRCVGADKGQVGRGVLVEAGILGAVASFAGVVLGAGLGQLALWVAHRQDLSVPLPSTISLTWQVVVVPVVVGTLVTVVAALVPARAATRVAPLEALRPADAPTTAKGSAGRLRLVLSLVAVIFGFGFLAGGAALGTVGGEASIGLLMGIAGGALSFVGVAVGAVFWLPKVAGLAGRLVGASGPTARLAAANTLRNPRRTAATSTALLIGVTLVAMMSTGAESARASLTTALDSRYPVDVEISSEEFGDDGAATELSAAVRSGVAGVDDVAGVADVRSTTVTLPDRVQLEDGTVTTVSDAGGEGTPVELGAYGVDPDAGRDTVRATDGLTRLAPGTVVLPQDQAEGLEIADGDVVTLTGPDGSASLTVALSDIDRLVLAASDLATLDSGAVVDYLWVALADLDQATSVVPRIQDVVADSGDAVAVAGAAVERASFEQVIDTSLGIVVGLLAVAVVIALIGVANTLSLSVIERRRESATLRAIGLSKAQLRGMLAIEGILIAAVGAVLGVFLGLVYGWAGAAAALGVMGDVQIVVPWRDVALVLAVAVVAGLVASVVPGRTAARTSPVAALAVD